MPSIVAGYEYDVFISYRQKDNKYDGWVSEFVSNLKKELEATFKEDISVYFDENPHDGLLETHDVDESLKRKLKCVVFIPIISQTYCDPKSFAWNNEFLSFKKSASEDSLGLKVQLASGNVASRILPVRIHNLQSSDVELYERESGTKLRAIDFIYAAPGVDRPLRSKDDDLSQEKGRVLYRNQITKVALAIREIINGIQSRESKGESREHPTHKATSIKKSWMFAGVAVLLIILAIIYFNHKEESVKEKPRIAILPFKLIGDKEGEYFASGMKLSLVKHLQSVDQLSVPPSLTQTENFADSKLSYATIAQELKADYLITATAQKWGDSIQLYIQLLDPQRDKTLWKQEFRQPFSKVFEVQTKMAKEIVKNLQVTLSQKTADLLERAPTANLEAYDLYLQGLQYSTLMSKSASLRFGEQASDCFKRSIQKDPEFAEAYAALAITLSFDVDHVSRISQDSIFGLFDKALHLQPDNSQALNYKAQVTFILKHDTALTIKLTEQSIKSDPNNIDAIFWLGWLYHYWFKDNREIEGLQQYLKAYNIDPDFRQGFVRRNLGLFFQYVDDSERAQCFLSEAVKGETDNQVSQTHLAVFYQQTNQPQRLKDVAGRMAALHEKYPDNFDFLYYNGSGLLLEKNTKAAIEQFDKYVEKTKKNPVYWKQFEYLMLLQKNGDAAAARKLCEQAIAKIKVERDTFNLFTLEVSKPVSLARGYTLLGETKTAMEYIRKIKFGPFYPGMHQFLLNDPVLEPLKSNREFQSIIEREKDRLKKIRDRIAQLEKEKLLIIPQPCGKSAP